MNYAGLLDDISSINDTTQAVVTRSVNQILTVRNWFIGAYIVEYEQNGADRAAYGTELIKRLANDLKSRNIKGLAASNLKNFRQFALTYPGIAKDEILSALLPLVGFSARLDEIRQTVSGEFETSSPSCVEEQENPPVALFPTLLDPDRAKLQS